MAQKRPILIWRLKDAPAEVIQTLIEDGFIGEEESYQKWRAGKTGEEFVVLVPDEYAFDDMDVASELGLNVAMTDAEEENPDCEEFAHLHYGRDGEGLHIGYDGYVIPALTGRTAIPTIEADDE